MEGAYTKSDVMQALAGMRTPVPGERGMGMVANDTDPMRFALAGAEAMAAVLLDGLDAEGARKKLLMEVAIIAAVSVSRTLVGRHDRREGVASDGSEPR